MSNMTMTRRALGAAAVALSLAATAAFAQQPGRIRGQIEKADGAMLVLKTRDGAMLNVKVADDARVAALVKASLADIKKDTLLASPACRSRTAASRHSRSTSSCPRSVA